ncbi:MAG: transporter substrate-binding domain-containing protein, partial [Planctomycetes bacterium]|nr:transporter substrate-binding domain-containing protein [Planctomycetota bacterium]
DFSHPFHTTGLAIATRAEQSASIGAVLKRLFSMQFLRAIAGLGLLLFVVGVLVWYAERRRNPEEFGGPVLRGIGSGFWWSAVTMTTVGYGDKSPRTFVGRAIALVWMFAAIILISGVTAAITTALTVSSLEGRVRGPDDLSRVNVGALRGTTGNEWLTGAFVSHTDYADMASGLRALQVGDIDAFVH